MGVAKSSQQVESNEEGRHFRDIIQRSHAGKSSGKGSTVSVKASQLCQKAKIIKRIDSEKLWTSFLSSAASTFALTKAETTTLLKSSLKVRFCFFSDSTL